MSQLPWNQCLRKAQQAKAQHISLAGNAVMAARRPTKEAIGDGQAHHRWRDGSQHLGHWRFQMSALLHRRENTRQHQWHLCQHRPHQGKAQHISLLERIPRQLERL